MIDKLKAVASFIRKKIIWIFGGITAALMFFISIFIKRNSSRTDTKTTVNISNRKRDFNREKERIEKKSDEAFKAMHDHLSSIPASELCDSFKESCDAIHEGKRRLGERYAEYRKTLHSVRGGCHD